MKITNRQYLVFLSQSLFFKIDTYENLEIRFADFFSHHRNV